MTDLDFIRALGTFCINVKTLINDQGLILFIKEQTYKLMYITKNYEIHKIRR